MTPMQTNGKTTSVNSDLNPERIPPALRWILQAPFFQAGLAGYSDMAMRMVARDHGCPYCITEAMLDHFLINGGKGVKHAELVEHDHPIAGQLMGSQPEPIAEAAKILVKLGYDVVDINLACPVKKIKKKARGGHLLSDPDEAIAILDAVKQAVGDDVPLTVKLRRGTDDEPASEANFHRIFESLIEFNYSAATVHSRTVVQKYKGPGYRPFLGKITKIYPDFLIFGSGDIFSPQSIFEMIEATGVRAVSVARGCIGNPWIFHQAHQLMQGETLRGPTLQEQRDVLEKHFKLSVECHGEHAAGRMMRKFGIKFSVHHPLSEEVSKSFIAVKNLSDWRVVLEKYYAKGQDGQEGVGFLDQATLEAIHSAKEEGCSVKAS